MINMLKPTIKVSESQKGSLATFVIEPLERGYGVTLGNALRRTLYKALPGAAIIGIKIEGVPHEFGTVPGVKEDVSEIILNLKEIAIKIHNEQTFSEAVTVTLAKSKPGAVTAKDIILPSSIEIMNPEAPICTLDDHANLKMEITIGKGRGYVSAKENKNPKAPIGYIPIDSIFSPVLFASYDVEAARVEHSIEYDRLNLKVQTNSASSPQEVVSLSAKILNDHLRLFVGLVDTMEGTDVMVTKSENTGNKASQMTIEELDLSVRPLNCLKRAGIYTVEDLTKRSKDDMMKVRNLGAKSLDEIEAKLIKLNLSFATQDE